MYDQRESDETLVMLTLAGEQSAYKKLFPKHLSDDVDRMCQNMFSNLYVTIVAYAQRNGEFETPSKNCYCEVMIQR